MVNVTCNDLQINYGDSSFSLSVDENLLFLVSLLLRLTPSS